jgi:hypothetical protein
MRVRAKLGLRCCPICVVDCDLYESARRVLEFVEPLLADGSILLFDDWNATVRPEQGRAARLRRVAEPLMDFPGQGQGLVLRVDASSGLN